MALRRWLTLGVITLGLTVAGPIGLTGCQQEDGNEQAPAQEMDQAAQAANDAAQEAAEQAAEQLPGETEY